MPFMSDAWLLSQPRAKSDELMNAHLNVGHHPTTEDYFMVPQVDRFSGMYIIGVQGVGKSTFMERMVWEDIQDMTKRIGAVIVIDPHGDLVDHCLAQFTYHHEPRVYVLDMEDEGHPFGVNLFAGNDLSNPIGQAQVVDRVMHLFEVLWPEVISQQFLPIYLRAATITLLANPGSTLVDMEDLFLDARFRRTMLKQVTDQSVLKNWRLYYDEVAEGERMRRIQPLLNRLSALFMGRSLVRNIVGQRDNTIDFRKAIEQKEIIFIKLPLKKLRQDAQLIGTILMSQISAAVFSFGDRPANKRPGVSLYVDEFQHFATPDFKELYTEGRKYGVRVTVAHQHRDQLPEYLRSATMTARTKFCFQLTPSDAREMAHLFYSDYAEVQKDDIETDPIGYLLKHGSDNHNVRQFTDSYLRRLQAQRREGKEGKIEITFPGLDIWTMFAPAEPNPMVDDPTTYLNNLLHQVMLTKRATLPIPMQVLFGFSNCGWAFYRKLLNTDREKLRSSQVGYPSSLTSYTPQGELRWNYPPTNAKEQMYHFVFMLRKTMECLAEHPVGKKSAPSTSDMAHALTSLPRGRAYVRCGEDVGVIDIKQPMKNADRSYVKQRMAEIQQRTRQKYCKPKAEVEGTPPPPTDEPPQADDGWEDV